MSVERTQLDIIFKYARMSLAAARSRHSRMPHLKHGDAQWLILLDTYVMQYERRVVSISSACLGSGVPGTTALRHIEILAQNGYVARVDDSKDKRRTFLSLTDLGRNKVVDVIGSEIRSACQALKLASVTL